MNITVHAGHNPDGKIACGAIGLLKESTVNREVVRILYEDLENYGIEVKNVTVNDGKSSQDVLKRICAQCNEEKRDLNISIHFNASVNDDHIGDGKTKGTEIWLYDENSTLKELAEEILKGFECLGLKNRGVKYSKSLYVLKHTVSPTMLIECCFVDDMDDVKLYNPIKFSNIISDAVIKWHDKNKISCIDKIENYVYNESEIKTREQFIEFVAMVSQWDWYRTKRILPSIKIAQALKESNFGKSELAVNAKALYGIKLNGWEGSKYVKTAIEQKPDGTYIEVPLTEWRKYNNWFESIINHSEYLSTRKIGNQSEPNWSRLIGESNYILAAQHLQSAKYPYATSVDYSESLINDYIERYNLSIYDHVTYETYMDICDILFKKKVETKAPDGKSYYVVVGQYSIKENAEEFSKVLKGAGIINRVVLKENDL